MTKNPAEMLEGKILQGGWKVLNRVDRHERATGGFFSVGYIVKAKDGTIGFLKALDYSKAFEYEDPPSMMQWITSAFNYERDILKKCGENRLSNVVMALDDGKIKVDEVEEWNVVNYIILERADGDVRKYLELSATFDIAWILRSLHHISKGLRQLHTHGISHRDLKPSNVLVFSERTSKIGDIGSAAYKADNPPIDELFLPGDKSYAPPELLYGESAQDWQSRLASDLYLLGSMVIFFFLGVGMTNAWVSMIHYMHRPINFSGNYDEVLPYVRGAIGNVITDLQNDIRSTLSNDVAEIVRELCEADPRLRGHPKNRIGFANPYSLEWYVSRFNMLASRAEYGLFRG